MALYTELEVGRLQSRSGHLEKEKNLLLLPAIKPIAHNVASMKIELS
jgi:hypothetical protein